MERIKNLKNTDTTDFQVC